MYLLRKLLTYVVIPASLQTTVFPGLCQTQVMNGLFNTYLSQSTREHVPADICSQCTHNSFSRPTTWVTWFFVTSLASSPTTLLRLDSSFLLLRYARLSPASALPISFELLFPKCTGWHSQPFQHSGLSVTITLSRHHLGKLGR